MPPRIVLDLSLAFKAMDAVIPGRRRKKTISYYSAAGERRHIRMAPYTADPTGYDGPEVLECVRPPKKTKKVPEPEPEGEPEQLHLYVTAYAGTANERKTAHIPSGDVCDLYLLDRIAEHLEEMEANGQDGHDLTLEACVAKVAEHFDVLDDDNHSRLLPIWRCALNKLTSQKIDGLSMMQEECLRMIEEDRQTIFSSANRIAHVEERVDDLEQEVDELREEVGELRDEMREEVDDLTARVERLELGNGGSLVDASASSVSENRHVQDPRMRAARMPAEQMRVKRMRAARMWLTRDEVEMIRRYTESEGCAEINGALREAAANGTTLSAPIRRSTTTMKSGLRKIEDYVGTVYRGVDMSADWIDNIVAQFKKQAPSVRRLRLRIPFRDAAFLSSSSKLTTSFGGKNCRFVIRSKTGKEIAAYSVHPKEHEVLFAPGTMFTIRDVILLDDGSLFLRMQEN